MKMYDKRDGMITLKNYRRFPHSETKLSKRCLYSVLHSQLCRFAARCTHIRFFEAATAKLMTDMVDHSYDRQRLDRKLHNFKKAFFTKSPIDVRRSYDRRVRDLYWFDVECEIARRIGTRDFVS